jgi:hypothetical protein
MAFNQYVSLGEETTWGTAVTRTKFAKVYEGSFLDQIADREVSGVIGANVGADAESNFDRGQRGEGKIIIPVSYDDMFALTALKHMFGLYAVTGVGPYTHTLNRGAMGPPFAAGTVATAQGLSVELNYELPDTSLAARLLSGGMVKSGTFSWNMGEPVKLELDLIGKSVTQVAKTGSATFPTYSSYEQTFAQCGIVIDGTGGDVSSVVTGFDLTIDNGYEANVTLGSVNTRQPKRRGKSNISGTIRMQWDGATSKAKALWDKFVANTASSAVLTLTGPTNYSWVLTVSTLRFNAGTVAPQEGAIQTVDFPFTVFHTASDTAVKLVASNMTATI